MVKHFLSSTIAAVLLVGCANTQQSSQAPYQLIESVSVSDDKLSVPYKKYQLNNGLTVILHPDNSDPLVHVDVTYHVGSSREEPGKSGFAHFFEHMMFQGSKHVADEEHIKMVTESGGTMNGTTNADRTNYFQTVPSNQLEKMLWLESDRMGFMLEAVTQQKFEVQRETVKNERGQRVDNAPYGLLQERLAEALYPKNHPYSWQTIGYIEDLNRVTVADLKDFFLRWYGPNNATLTIGGDIDELQTMQMIEKYFGEIPRGPEVADLVKTPVVLEQDKYISFEDEVHLPLVYISFPTAHVRHEDEAPLDILSDILGGGKSSLFYKNLVKSGLAVQANVSHPCRELACTFDLYALGNPAQNVGLDKLEQVIRATLTEFEQRGVNDDDLKRTQATIESGTIYGLQSVSGKVSTLAYNQTFFGNPDMFQYDLDRYNRVSKADVMRVYQQYIKDKASVTVSIVPKGRTELIAQPDNFEFTGRDDLKISLVNEKKLDFRYIDSKIDRSVAPKSGASPTLTVPELWRSEFDNGLALIGTVNNETPTVTISIGLEGGSWVESISKAGVASLTSLMMNESSQQRSTETLSNELAKLGASVSFSTAGRYNWINISSLTKNLDQTLAIAAEKLLTPKFDKAEFERIKNQTLQNLSHSKKKPEVLINWAFSNLLYGSDKRIGFPDIGTTESIANLTVDDVKAYYQHYYSPKHAQLIVVGDLDKNTVINKLSFLKTWQGPDYSVPSFNQFETVDTNVVYVLDKPDAAQTQIRLGRHAMPYDATGRYFKSTLMNFALGGAFNSRINLNLREDKGYTYGARARYRSGKMLGQYTAGAGVKPAHTADALNEFLQEMDNYQSKGITEQELSFMRQSISQSDALKYETPSDKSRFLQRLIEFDLPASFVEQQAKIIDQISAEEINQLAKAEIDTTKMVKMMVGDKARVIPQLEKAGFTVKLLEKPFN